VYSYSGELCIILFEAEVGIFFFSVCIYTLLVKGLKGHGVIITFIFYKHLIIGWYLFDSIPFNGLIMDKTSFYS
jgi:hypothetical protein